jgi:CotH kinase protein
MRRKSSAGWLRRGFAFALAFACLASLDTVPTARAVDPPPGEAAWMFDPDAVVEIELGGLSEEELDALEVEPPDEYQKATFELKVDGVPKGPLLTDVGIRRKGGASLRPIKTGKSGLKIRFDEFVKGQRFFGLERLTLNSMIQDPSMVRETITYELFDAMDLPASRSGYAFLRVNGEVHGLYLNLETLDKVWLPRWFESTQHLYEADAGGVDVGPGGAGAYEVDRGPEDDLSDLEALIAAVNDEEGDWSEGMGPVADLVQMTRMWAVERYVHHWDGYAGKPDHGPNNYYLHSDAAGVFRMLPWGTDQTWDVPLEFGAPAKGLMFNECLADASCLGLYEGALTDVYQTAPGLELGARALELGATLAPFHALESEPRRAYTPEKFAKEIEDTCEMAEERPEELREWLGLPLEDPPGSLPCELVLPEPEPEPEPGPDPGLESSASPSSSSEAGPPKASPFWVGPAKLRGSRVATRLWLPASSRAAQRVVAGLGKRRRLACVAERGRGQAGFTRLRCRLPEWALRRLEEGPLSLSVTVSVVLPGGEVDTRLTRLTVPRRDL